ncbi:hypothetical protein [Streptomyces clavuligerus]|uniref:hypothetical protein n=1 Tax=Streptomyces clavuligerus TaxID=1901 RepID=UPI00017FF5DC|nr:hypothetical protein [Streptomyces clavuligerus]EDY49205.1 hypothetical protein SSCG_02233 [Streptomyces clavuligerus]WDN56119.1 hypothetical protein LL058_30125 [Streptomyces clavuligerus]
MLYGPAVLNQVPHPDEHRHGVLGAQTDGGRQVGHSQTLTGALTQGGQQLPGQFVGLFLLVVASRERVEPADDVRGRSPQER